ncbi:extracellular solute-binding protein [Marinovum sp. 2_MG-2023]|uniref:extracellular solute-binding protein n=1 Tax=unclassified Marinovum TaxID=2647166 RepID=UPI0026E37011|nr:MULTISPECIES: extracellular solute-binding protein [unclassified Marinovum]MDO6728753.1 extracellular solute-binding protein [Marinovum sp. 2_MG-2023]MDO6777831.1 extracellular solute-binding protein [Marinovum sp. 1_MG-2023]
MTRTALTSILALTVASAALAEGSVNIYSSRHYDNDESLYEAFTEQTGIEVNRIEANADELIARMTAEGANSPADVFLTVDAGRIWRADEAGLLQAVDSDVLDARIPAHLRHPDGHWFGFSQRARIIFYDKNDVENPPLTYEDLTDAAYEGQVCIRSSSNVYNQSLMASIIDANGEEAALDWAKGVVANMARDPQGGDTDQLRGIVSGECEIAVTNTYYFLRGLASGVDGLSDGIENIGWVFPNQSDRGAHVNVAAAGVAVNAPNRDNAVAFLEYLATDDAQAYFANQNNEYAAVPGIALAEVPARLGLFRADDLNLSVLGEQNPTAQKLFNEAGWE